MPSIRLNIDEATILRGVERAIDDKVKKGLSKEVKFAAANDYKDTIERYVPSGPSYKGHTGGALRRNARVVPDGDDFDVRYSATSPKGYDYAAAQYNGSDWWNRHTPDTYSHWNRHITRAERLAYYQRVADMIKGGMNG